MRGASVVVSAVFGCVVATGAVALPGPLTPEKVLAVGTATLATLFVAALLGRELRPRG